MADIFTNRLFFVLICIIIFSFLGKPLYDMVRDNFMNLNQYIENQVKSIVAFIGYYSGDIMNKTASSVKYAGQSGIDDLSNDEYNQKIVLNPYAAQLLNANLDSMNDGVHVVGNQLKKLNKPYIDTHLFNSTNRCTNHTIEDVVPDMTDSPIQSPSPSVR